MRTKISQREAHRLRKLVIELERNNRERINRWSNEWPGGGVNIDRIALTSEQYARINVAMKLDHCIVGKLDTNGNLLIYAVKP